MRVKKAAVGAIRWFRTVCGLHGFVQRREYLINGIVLAFLKYAVEASVIRASTGRHLTPVDFVSPSLAKWERVLQGAPEWLGWGLFVWSVPFIWIALGMSVRRSAAAGLSPWLGTAVLIPGVNLALMAVLCFLPDRFSEPASDRSLAGRATSCRRQGEKRWATIRALLAALAVGFMSIVVGIYWFQTYGAVLFFGTPLVMGMVAGFLANQPAPRKAGETVGIGMAVMLLAGGVLLAFALEGLICLVMAAPLVMPTAMAGALLGRWIATSTASGTQHLVPVLMVLPLLAGAESLIHTPPEYEVLTVVEIDAAPDAVWRHVVAFPDLPDPEDWFFRCGIACPLRARIEGEGVGAIRHCEFTTGNFVEPITVWEEPWHLAFDVSEQPDPMVEMSPWRHVHPPHLADHSLRSHRGEFRLTALPNGQTQLAGRTWYTFDMYPQAYWTAWSHFSIHKIHRRVLDHIKWLAEQEPQP